MTGEEKGMQRKVRGQVEGVTEARDSKKAKGRKGREVNKLKEGRKGKKEKEREARRVGIQGGTLDFRVTGLIKWDPKSKPKKTPRPNFTPPKNSIPNLWALKIFKKH